MIEHQYQLAIELINTLKNTFKLLRNEDNYIDPDFYPADIADSAFNKICEFENNGPEKKLIENGWRKVMQYGEARWTKDNEEFDTYSTEQALDTDAGIQAQQEKDLVNFGWIKQNNGCFRHNVSLQTKSFDEVWDELGLGKM